MNLELLFDSAHITEEIESDHENDGAVSGNGKEVEDEEKVAGDGETKTGEVAA